MICAAVAAFLITDVVLTKAYCRPPVFCIRAVTFDDGVSGEYYGAGYKIKRSYSTIDGSEEYFVTLWVLPDNISL